MKEDAPISSQPKSATLSEECSAEAKPRFEGAKSRVASFLTALTPKKKTTPEKPPRTQDEPIRPGTGPERAALFLDSKGKIVAAHQRCVDLFGRQPVELSGLNIKVLVKPGFDQQITDILAKGKEAHELSSHVLALRKDGSEFAAQFSLKFLQDFNFRWAVFVQVPDGGNGATGQSIKGPQAIVPTTETTTTETPKPESGEASQNERHLERIKLEVDEQLRQDQLDYENHLIRLEQDLLAEPEIDEPLLKGPEAQGQSAAPEKTGDEFKEQQTKPAGDDRAAGEEDIEDQAATGQRLEAENRNLTEAKAELDKEREAIKVSRKKGAVLQTQVQTLQDVLEEAEARAHESAPQSKDWEKRASLLKKSVEELTRRHAAEQHAAIKAAQRVNELEEQLKRAGDDRPAGKKDVEDQNDTRHRLKAENHYLSEAVAKARADLNKERDAIKVSREKEEELQTQVQTLQGALEQAEARAHESAPPSKDWEKKVADLKKSVEELTRRHAAEQKAAVKAARRVKELEEQLKRAGEDRAAGDEGIEDQDGAHEPLEAENRDLIEANAKARAELEEEREAIETLRKKEEELQTQVQKLQGAFEKAEARGREGAAQSKDLEKKAADLKKSFDELTRSHAAEQSASAKRVKELEQQLKRAGDDLASSKAENCNLPESAETQAALEKKNGELEERVRKGVFSLAKVNAELESERVERERAEKSAASATAQMEKLKEKLKQQVELERAGQGKMAELERTIQDRRDDLARASAALRKEAKERHIAQKRSRLVSEIGNRIESNLASLEDAKKGFEASLNEKNERLQKKDERLQLVERSLAEANSGLEKESAERQRVEGLLADARQQLAESKAEISRLHAALDLRELQRKQLESNLLESSDIAENAGQEPGAAPDKRAGKKKRESK